MEQSIEFYLKVFFFFWLEINTWNDYNNNKVIKRFSFQRAAKI